MSSNSQPTNLSQQIAALSPAQRQLLERRLSDQGIQINAIAGIPPRSPQQECPLSFAQQRLWFIQQLDPEGIAYNVPCALSIQGKLSYDALQQAIDALTQRHETLRTRFVVNAENQPIQVIEPAQTVNLEIINYQGSIGEIVQQQIQSMADRPIDLSQSVVQWQLLQLAEDDHILLILTHHIICDRWGVGIFLQDLSTLYAAALYQQPNPLKSLPIQYADWAIWQRQQLQGDQLQAQLNYWTAQLAGDLPILNLPHNPIKHLESTAKSFSIELPSTMSAQLRQLASKQDVTLFMLLLGSFQTLLRYYTGEEDILIGSDIVNRDRQETEGLIGLLVNTLVLRTDLSGNPTFPELLQRLREVTLQAYAHQQLPFEKIVEALNPERDLAQYMPLFQVKFDLQLAKVESPSLIGLSLSRLPVIDRSPKYDLRLNLQDTSKGISGQFEFDGGQFSDETIEAMAAHWQQLLLEILENPALRLNDYSILTAQEQQQFERWNQTHRAYPASPLPQLFETQVSINPEAIALVVNHQQLSYKDLNAQANQLAHHLIGLGLGKNQPVGILLDRDISMIPSILGVLKAGAAYVPIDSSYPIERIEFLLKDAEISLLISQKPLIDRLFKSTPKAIEILDLANAPTMAGQSTENPNRAVDPDDLAYIIYTSGSTGVPKGVAIAHHSPAALIHWARETFTPSDWQGVLAATSICFDLSIFEIFGPLCSGGCVILLENALALPHVVQTLPEGHHITLINTVPSAIRALFEQDAIPPTVQVINLAGEALSAALVRRLYSLPQIRSVNNLYGPSEDTTYSTYIQLDRNVEKVTIGKPIANTEVLILNQQGQPLPLGVAGELHLSGAGLSQGYWRRPDLTQNQFIQRQNKRWYRTGDQARFLPNGEIEYLGRLDNQVKVRGYRIELGEIDYHLEQHPEIDQAISLVMPGNDAQLIAYYVGTADKVALQAYLAERLPSYMVPQTLVHLEAFPLTANGKVDRPSLPSLSIQESFSTPPRNAIEQTIADLWQRELKLETIGIQDNFFALGGHSLLGMKIMAQISEAIAQPLPLKYLFQFPTIEKLANQIIYEFPNLQSLGPTSKPSDLPTITPDITNRHQPFPLTPIQQAYLIGRNGAFELGNISTHAYREIDTNHLHIEAVEQALNQLISQHDMLRMQIHQGKQEILAQVPHYHIPRLDLSQTSPDEREALLQEWRDRLSHQVLDASTYPLFYVQAIRLEAEKIRFCIGFDILLGDAWSFQRLGQDFFACLNQTPPPPLSLSFRDYVLAIETINQSEARERALEYWRSRLKSLPMAPELPLVQPLSAIDQPKFTRYSGKLSPGDWRALKQRASAHNLTPSTIVLATFAEVLRRWSANQDFTINLTLFNRLPLHPEVNQIIGDFTASSLLEIQDQPTFIDRAQQIQAQLWQDLAHSQMVGGVEVLRMLAQEQQQPTAALMPIVFTSTLTQEIPAMPTGLNWQSEVVYSISQTSQVYLDHQVSEVEGILQYNWDVIEALFPEGLISDMFSAYEGLLLSWARETQDWAISDEIMLPESYRNALNYYNQTETPFDQNLLLHDLFFQQVDRSPQSIALIASGQQFTYRALADKAIQLAVQLQEIQPEIKQPVLIWMEKGWEQVVAVIAVLATGRAYVPLEHDLPPSRLAQILASTEAEILLTQRSLFDRQGDWIPGELAAIAVDSVNLDPPIDAASQKTILENLGGGSSSTDLAYIIYTSGSTGIPKGVIIDHRGAVNTILEINRRWQVKESDRLLALSALSFDLSVYDIFGILAAGGAIVMPDADRAKQVTHWQELVTDYGITLWNSVPALFELYIANCPQPNSLRMAWLSGDWVSTHLAGNLIHNWPQLKLVSLGGATEASIWSIFHPIQSLEADWQSIPYGKPLANQQIYILDAQSNCCPPWVVGEIWIAGMGLAQGYWGDIEQTNRAFQLTPRGRLYRTGDLGRYRCLDHSLVVEFLGRRDFQVKLNGYRIELGEISATLQAQDGIEQAVVQVVGSGNRQQLVAYIKASIMPSQKFDRLNPLAQIEFKQQEHHLYRSTIEQITIDLPKQHSAPSRSSYRQFLSQSVALEDFTGLLSALQATYAEAHLPKYHYPSAGGLYPVQAYVYLKPQGVTDLPPGLYYYHPKQHQLILISASKDWDSAIYGINQAIFEQAAFAIFLVAQMDAIAPIYGDRSRDFCLLEAGYIGQLLMHQAAAHTLGLCPIGEFEFDPVAADFKLTASQALLHSFVGGVIDPAAAPTVSSPQSKFEWLKAQLQKKLRAKLPSYMVPHHFILVDHIPLSANGKVDFKALPSPRLETASQGYKAPENATQRQLAELWQTILAAEQIIGIDDPFFELGGNSLSMMQIITQTQQQFQVTIPIATFFSHPTIRQQGDWILANAKGSELADSPIQPAAIAIDQLSEAELDALLSQLAAQEES